MNKKVLIFIDWYLPGYKAGGPIQSIANLVAHLKDDFEFSIITQDTDYCETEPYKGIKSNEWNILNDGIRVYYFSSDRLTRANVRNLIRKEKFDAVYLNGIYSVYFTLYPLYFLRKKCANVVIASRGMFAESALGVKKAKKRVFIRTVKILRLFENVVFHATTENEKIEIEKNLGPTTQIKIAGNLPQKIAIDKLPKRIKPTDSVRLINVARIAPEKNLLFALQVLKDVKTEVEFDFYGPVYNQDYWQECQEAIAQLPKNIKATYKGSIESEKVLSTLKEYHFMFMPTRGENFGHIIIQSLSVGCPVIISDQTPWKDLGSKKAGWDISLQETELFINTIDQCARMEQTAYDQLSGSAFELARIYSSNTEIIEQNKRLFI